MAWVIGVDEVGLGCLAGPFYVCAFASPTGNVAWPSGIRDSKLISSKRVLQGLADTLGTLPKTMHAVTRRTPEEIDKLGAGAAWESAVHETVTRLLFHIPRKEETTIIVDGSRLPKGAWRIPGARAVVQGDTLCTQASAASIIAKAARDQEMHGYADDYPAYGFDKHVGYPTKYHLEALRVHGVTPIHRKSVKPVAEILKCQKQLSLTYPR